MDESLSLSKSVVMLALGLDALADSRASTSVWMTNMPLFCFNSFYSI